MHKEPRGGTDWMGVEWQGKEGWHMEPRAQA